MGKQAFEAKIAAVEALRREPERAESELRKALRERNNFLVSKAAAVAEALDLRALQPDLVAAFERFLHDPVKSDPQCWAKNAIAKALKNLDHDDAAVFLRGARHQQWEPVWSGRADTATTLRGTCAHALIGCGLPNLELLSVLSDLLVDQAAVVRVEAARAIGASGAAEGSLLLRLKARAGDQESQVTGQCFSTLIGMGLRGAIPFVAEFLGADDPAVRMEAAGALAESREEEAIAPLETFWPQLRDPRDKEALLKLLAFSPAHAAGELLRKIGADESDSLAAQATELLRASRHWLRLNPPTG